MDEASADQVSAEVVGEAPAPPRRPATRPYSRLISAALLLILVVLTIDVLVHGPLTGLDERIRAGVLARADSPAWRWLSDTPHRPALLLTDLGMNTVAVPVLAAVAVVLAIRRHTLRPLLIAVTGVVLLLATVIPAKNSASGIVRRAFLISSAMNDAVSHPPKANVSTDQKMMSLNRRLGAIE